LKESAKLSEFFISPNLFFSFLQIMKNLFVSAKTPCYKELCYLLPTPFRIGMAKVAKELIFPKLFEKIIEFFSPSYVSPVLSGFQRPCQMRVQMILIRALQISPAAVFVHGSPQSCPLSDALNCPILEKHPRLLSDHETYSISESFLSHDQSVLSQHRNALFEFERS